MVVKRKRRRRGRRRKKRIKPFDGKEKFGVKEVMANTGGTDQFERTKDESFRQKKGRLDAYSGNRGLLATL